MANGTQTHFRFRNDDGSETTATWRAATDTNVSIAMQQIFRLRIAYTSGYSTLTGWDLYYSYNSGAYTAVTNSSLIKVVSSSLTGLDGTSTTQQISVGGTWTAGYEVASDAAYTSIALPVPIGNLTEFEFCLQIPTGLDVGDTISLKLAYGSTLITSISNLPTITISSWPLGINVVDYAINTTQSANSMSAMIDSRGANLLLMVIMGKGHTGGYLGLLTETGVTNTNTWNALTAYTYSAATSEQIIYWAQPANTNYTGSQHTVTFGLTALESSIAFIALSGAADLPYDQTSGSNNVGSNSAQPGNITLPTTGCFVVTTVGNYTGTPSSVSSGDGNLTFTSTIEPYVGSTKFGGGFAWGICSAADTINPTWTLTAHASTSVGMWTFAPAEFTISTAVSPIPSNHSTNIIVTCTGVTYHSGATGTNWPNIDDLWDITSNSVPPTGCTLVSQNWNNSTSFTLAITTGSGTGTISLCVLNESDTSLQEANPITVAAASLAISPTSDDNSDTITLTGTNTMWSTDIGNSNYTLSNLFIISSDPAPSTATLSFCSITSQTAGTIFFACQTNGSGAVVIQDVSTGATATLTYTQDNGSSLGYMTIGAANQAVNNPHVCCVGGTDEYVVPINCNIESCAVYTHTAGIAVTMGIYVGASLSGATLVAQSTAGVTIADGWTVVKCTGALSAGQTIWIAFEFNASCNVWYTNANGAGGNFYYFSQAYGALPSTWPGTYTTNSTLQFNVKMDYSSYSLISSIAPYSPGTTNSLQSSTINTATANLITVVGWCYGITVSPTLTITDSAGNTWQTGFSQLQNYNTTDNLYYWFVMFYCYSPNTSGSHWFKITDTGNKGGKIGLAVLAHKGAKSTPLDRQNSTSQNSGPISTFQAGNITPTQDGQLVVVFLLGMPSAGTGGGNDARIDAGPLTTNLATIGGTQLSIPFMCISWLVQGMASAINPTWNIAWEGSTADMANAVSTSFFAGPYSGGGGGDPYFVGYDGEIFEFQGKRDKSYLLYESENLVMNMRLIDAITQCKTSGPERATYIDGIWIKYREKGIEHEILYAAWFGANMDNCGVIKSPSDYEFLSDFLPMKCFGKDFTNEIHNTNWRNFEVFELKLGFEKICLTRSFYIQQCFINFLIEGYNADATGILGQTSRKERIPNEEFEIPYVNYINPNGLYYRKLLSVA